jgi:outer membrane lipase/esterase
MKKHSIRQLIHTTVAALCLTTLTGLSNAWASSYSSVVFFGDSLSDTGNVNLLSGGVVPGNAQPYFQGRLSDGLLWTDYLAAGVGHASDAGSFLQGGNNYAFAGARTGGFIPNDVPGILAQTAVLWGSSHTASANDLFVLVGGGNDMRDARSEVGGTAATRQAAAEAAVANLQLSMLALASKGAQNFLLSTLPDLGSTFEATLLGNVAESSDASMRFNSLIPSLKTFGEGLGLNVSVLDMNGVLQLVRNNPAQFGISNTTLPCDGFLFSQGDACSASLFSDALHPSALSHQIIAAAAFATLGITPAAVPEPETVTLMAMGLVLLGAVARRSHAIQG